MPSIKVIGDHTGPLNGNFITEMCIDPKNPCFIRPHMWRVKVNNLLARVDTCIGSARRMKHDA